MGSVRFVSLFLLSLQATIGVQATCFTPNGTDRNLLPDAGPGVYFPCDAFAEVSMCCRSGLDLCVHANTLCYNNVTAHYWRESCTDSTWQSPVCTKLFVNGTGLNATTDTFRDSQGNVDNDAEITSCDDGSWCYGAENRGCCHAGDGFFVVDGEQTNVNPTASTSSSSSATFTTSGSSSSTSLASWTGSATSSPTLTAPAPLTSESSKSSGLSTGAKAAIGVCVAFASIAILAVAFWFIFRRSRRQQTPESQFQDYPDTHAPAKEVDPATHQNTEVLEAPAFQEKPLPEMESRTLPSELPATRY